MTRDRFPALHRIADRVGARNPLQARHLRGFLAKASPDYFAFAGELAAVLDRTLLRSDGELDRAADAYNGMCLDFLREQIRFQQSGVYSSASASAANEAVYQRPEVMQAYMEGLLVSYLFWPNHHAMLAFFHDRLPATGPGRLLEFAPGHGLFSALVLRRHPDTEATLVDISPTSLALAREVIRAFAPNAAKVAFAAGDVHDAPLTGTFPLVVMGELLEHVDDPALPVRRAAALVPPGGRFFVTTCANCPAVDHVYHFRNVSAIRGVLLAGGEFSIEEDLALPSDPVPEDQWEAARVTVNYAAWLRRE